MNNAFKFSVSLVDGPRAITKAYNIYGNFPEYIGLKDICQLQLHYSDLTH